MYGVGAVGFTDFGHQSCGLLALFGLTDFGLRDVALECIALRVLTRGFALQIRPYRVSALPPNKPPRGSNLA